MTAASDDVILERLNAIDKKQDKTIEKIDNLNGSVRDVQRTQDKQGVHIDYLTKEQDNLRKASNRNDGIVGGVMVSIMVIREAITEVFRQ